MEEKISRTLYVKYKNKKLNCIICDIKYFKENFMAELYEIQYLDIKEDKVNIIK